MDFSLLSKDELLEFIRFYGQIPVTDLIDQANAVFNWAKQREDSTFTYPVLDLIIASQVLALPNFNELTYFTIYMLKDPGFDLSELREFLGVIEPERIIRILRYAGLLLETDEQFAKFFKSRFDESEYKERYDFDDFSFFNSDEIYSLADLLGLPLIDNPENRARILSILTLAGAVKPKRITPKSVTPKSVTPKSVTPKSVTPKSVSVKTPQTTSLSLQIPKLTNVEAESPLSPLLADENTESLSIKTMVPFTINSESLVKTPTIALSPISPSQSPPLESSPVLPSSSDILNVDLPVSPNTGLWRSSTAGNLEKVKEYLRRGGDSYNQAAMLAAENGQKDVLEYFLNKAKEDKNIKLNSYLIAKSVGKRGDILLFDYLYVFYEEYYDELIKNEKEEIPELEKIKREALNGIIENSLEGAGENNNLDFINKVLLNEDFQNNYDAALKGLLYGKHGSSINFIDNYADKLNLNKALLIAAKLGLNEIVKLLMKKGATDLRAALSEALRHGHQSTADIFRMTNKVPPTAQI